MCKEEWIYTGWSEVQLSVDYSYHFNYYTAEMLDYANATDTGGRTYDRLYIDGRQELFFIHPNGDEIELSLSTFKQH